MSKWLNRISGFWVGLAIILIVAGGLRLLSYEYGLPYVEHADEPVFYQQVRVWRGLFDMDDYLDFYPPGYLSVNFVVQILTEAFGSSSMSATIHNLRLLAVTANLLTLVFVALSAKLAAGNWAGWMAGAMWGVSPLVLRDGVYATPDPIVYLLISLALWFAVVAATDPTRRHWCVWSVVWGLLTILTKYGFIPAVLPGGVVGLWVWTQNRRQGLRYLVMMFVLAALVLGFFLFIYPFYTAAMMDRVAKSAIDNGLQNVLDARRVMSNLRHAIIPLNEDVFIGGVALGLLAFIVAWWRKLPRVRVSVIALSLLVFITIPWIISSYSIVSINNRMKDVLPATVAACVLLGAGLAQLTYIVPRRWANLSRVGITGVFAVVVFVPQLQQDWRLVQERRLPDSRVALRHYVDINLEPGTIVVEGENHKTFNPYWGGLEARHWVDWWMSDNVMEYSLDEWRNERQMTYAAIPLSQWENMQASEAGRDYLAQMLHLRDFIGSDQRGPQVLLYRFWRMQHKVDIQFGETIHLVGYDQNLEQAAPGDDLTLRFYWQATARPATDYSLFIHFTPVEDYEVLAQADGAPAVPERPAPTWDIPDETLISPEFRLTIPAELTPGTYRVMVGLYNYVTGDRLPVTDVASGEPLGDAFELARITVSGG